MASDKHHAALFNELFKIGKKQIQKILFKHWYVRFIGLEFEIKNI